MAAERAQSLQDTFLNHVRFDNFCVLLRRDGHSQLVYKHAISTIMPGQPVHLMDADPAETPTS